MDNQPQQTFSVFNKKKRLEEDLTNLNQELYKRNIELNDTNQTLALLRKIDDAVLDSQLTLDSVAQKICDALLGLNTVIMAGVFTSQEGTESLRLSGLSLDKEFASLPELNTQNILIDHSSALFPNTTTELSINASQLSAKQVSSFLKIEEEPAEILLKSPFSSLLLYKLIVRYKVVGVLAFASVTPLEELSDQKREQLVRVSKAVGLAIDNKLLFEENQNMLKQVQHTNNKLKQLDETKDEFISMASHQLRTPLTSVKGYLSMVLEGDAGEISEMQKKLLDQAFVSSQRMVYLIADLLNLSRLKTGKFIIDAVPTDLAKMVDDEVNQLKDTAKSRGLTLEHNRPPVFPKFMLDETKIRQVMMNFIDNAIYYTPTGGHIQVELKETEKNIEFTVKDDGIGISKPEQAKLFTKFFRAGNAKKARPDGTGLGLFMVRKVIVAQGGSIIFQSQEGKGSTFGFIFEKDKIKITPQPEEKPINI